MSAGRESFVRTRLQGLRMIAGSLIGALVILALVVIVVLGLEEYPSPVTAAALFAINVAAFVIVEVVGYRTPAVPRDADEDTALRIGLDALQQTTITRFEVVGGDRPAGDRPSQVLASPDVVGATWLPGEGGPRDSNDAGPMSRDI